MMANKIKTKAKDPTHTILGMSTSNEIIDVPISKFPHALIAGTTGSGKSVFLESMLTCMFTHADPKDLKLIIIDPKGNEFGNYKDLPYMMTNPITDMDKSPDSLEYLATEMDIRFQKFNKYADKIGIAIKNLSQYNDFVDRGKIKDEKMPYVVLLIDELADLMTTHKDKVETNIKRIGAKARAAGIHMILATQSPRREVVTGLIKANVPTKISLMVGSGTESMIILGETGAENLKPHGDFYASINNTDAIRGQAPFVDNEDELPKIFENLRKNYPKPDLVDITEELERKKQEFAELKAEISGEAVEDIKAEADEFHKGGSDKPKFAQRQEEESEEKKEKRRRNDIMMEKIKENKKNKDKKPKKVSVDTSKLDLGKRNKMREKQGMKPRQKSTGIVKPHSSKDKPKNSKKVDNTTKTNKGSQNSNVKHTEANSNDVSQPKQKTESIKKNRPSASRGNTIEQRRNRARNRS